MLFYVLNLLLFLLPLHLQYSHTSQTQSHLITLSRCIIPIILIILITRIILTMLTVGDCHAVVCCGGAALDVSDPHKPNRPDEVTPSCLCVV